MTNDAEKLFDVLILGGGPAGLSAAIYAGRAGLSALLVERGVYGGNIAQASDIANYPGGIPGESGAEFSARLEAHADAFGVTKLHGAVSSVELTGEEKRLVVSGRTVRGRTLIIATGSIPVKLGFAGEGSYAGLGLSWCAVCDGPFFSGLDVYVIGGGDSALQESLYLARFCRKVTIIHRRSAFRAAQSLVERAQRTENISFLLDTTVVAVGGEGLLTRIETENVKTGARSVAEAAPGENFGVFVFGGMRAQTEIFDGLLNAENGYIVTDEEMRTNIPGVFAAGDVRSKTLRQVVTATADGAIAAIQAEKYLEEEVENGE